ncbi:MAG TPA: heparan-alpha-glucosaminide N-acetyltransferase domain-containing protein, partial [Thermoanaerobaculia bacterium]
LLEVTIVRLGWTFNFDYRHYVLLGVLWMLGWAMVALAGLVFLPYPAIAAIGFVVVFGHNVLDRWLPSRYDALLASPRGWLWQILYLGGTFEAGPEGPLLAVLYSLVPWIGVIALGYAFGKVLTWPDDRRRRACLAIGGAAVLLFLVLRGGNLYGNPSPWKPQASACRTALSFLNTRKYPASLQFLLMTLGPVILAVHLAEKLRGGAARFLEVFGRVPLFFYVLHIWLAHAIAAVLSAARYGHVIPWMFANHPYMPGPHPDGYGYGLAVVWGATALVALLLYPGCRAFAALKARRPGGWLSFL